MDTSPKRFLAVGLITSLSLITAACGSDTAETALGQDTEPAAATDATDMPGELASDWVGSYELIDEEFGTMVEVTVEDGIRTIVSNTLPDHETGEFPNDGNPNAIEEQAQVWEYPATGTNTGTATPVRQTGVAVNGVKFEPGTGESVTCAGGETYRIEALQDVYDLGLDFNNAHVQPGGEYHYHGVSSLLVDAYSTDNDLVHIGFAADGNLMYYSKSGAYASSYVLNDGTRDGTDCLASGPDSESFDVAGSAIDGTYTSDWSFEAEAGDLDECNGVEIDGTYVYLVTDSYPFVGRCVMGEASGDAGPGGGAPPAGGAGEGATGPGGAAGDDGATGRPGDAPDLTEAAETLGVTEAALIEALGSPPDFGAAAEALGIDVAELEAVLPAPPSGR